MTSRPRSGSCSKNIVEHGFATERELVKDPRPDIDRPRSRWLPRRRRSGPPLPYVTMRPRSSPTARAIPNQIPTCATTRTCLYLQCRLSFVDDPTERFATLEYRTAIDDYMRDEVLPYVPDAWVDHDRTKIGYEIPLTRHFYRYVPPRPLEDIDVEIKQLEAQIQELLREVTE